MLPIVSEQFEIIFFPAEFRNSDTKLEFSSFSLHLFLFETSFLSLKSDFLTQVVLFNFFGTYTVDRLLRWLFGFGTLKQI